MFDATAPGDLAALQVQALELLLRRAGLRTLTLTAATEPARLGRAHAGAASRSRSCSAARAPRSTRSAASSTPCAACARGSTCWPSAVRCRTPARAPSQRLGDEPLAARDALLERLGAQTASASVAANAPVVPAPDGEIVVARRHTAALPF